MAVAKQDSGSKKNTNTTKEQNKQAIQNINRTGTVSGKSSNVKGSSSVVRDTTNTSNLAGNNRQQALGTPKMTSPSKVNVMGKASTQEKGKTYVPSDNYSTSKVNTRSAKTTLQNNSYNAQTSLSGMADESNKKAQGVLNAIGNAINKAVKDPLVKLYQNNVSNTEDRRRAVYDRVAEAKENKRVTADKNRAETRKNTTQEDYNAMFDEGGNVRDFQSEINSRKNRANELANVIATSENGMDVSFAQTELQKVQDEIKYWEDLEDKYYALEEDYNLGELQKKGDTETYNSYRDMISHRKDNIAQRAVTAGEHLASSFANEVPSLIDQTIYLADRASLDNALADIETNRPNMSNDDYVNALATVNEEIQTALDNYNAGLSRSIQTAVDQYSANTYYGATDVEKFVLQAGESTAQFLMHFIISKGMAQAFSSTTALEEAGRNAIAEGVTNGFIGSADDMAVAVENEIASYKSMVEATGKSFSEELVRLGENQLGGDISTYLMSFAGVQEKTNEMIQMGLPADQIALNAGMSYLLSYEIEKIGMDRFVDMLGTPASVDAYGRVLNTFKGGLSEGLEEVAEGLIEPLIDAVTLGKDYEVNGNEVLMAFLLGGTSGLVVSGSANIASGISAIPTVGKMVINNRVQRNMVLNQIALLEKHIDTMTPHQLDVYNEVVGNSMQSVNEYDSKSQTLGVELSTDEVAETSYDENQHNVIEAFTQDFNEEVQNTNRLEVIQAENEKKILNVVNEENTLIEATQNILNQNGYDIDARVFNSLSEKERNNALVALDFSKVLGVKTNITNKDGIRQAILDNGFSGTRAELERLVNGSKGVVTSNGEIFVNANAQRPILYTLTHELTHGTESSKYYPALRDLVKKTLGDKWDSALAERTEAYKNIKNADPEKELVARTVEEFLGDEKFIDDLIKYNYSLASKIWQDLKALASNDETDKIRNTFEKAFADSLEKDADTNRNFSYSLRFKDIIQRVAPNAINPETGKFRSVLSQLKNLRNDPRATGNVVVPLGESLMFAGVSNALFIDKSDLTHIEKADHNIDDATLAHLLHHLDDYVVLGLDYTDRRTTAYKKDIILDDGGKRYIMGLYKSKDGYNLNKVNTMYEYGDDPDHSIGLFILRNLGENHYYYANEKSSDFLKRLGINSQDAVRKSTALDYRVAGERRGVKFSLAESEIDKKYMDAVNSGNMEEAQRLVYERAKEYARRTGQQMHEGYHGTNAVFNEFLEEKLGSKNFLAESARLGYFMSGSKETAESYTGLNSADMFRINYDKNMEEKRQQLRNKYGLDELEEADKNARNQFIEESLDKVMAEHPYGKAIEKIGEIFPEWTQEQKDSFAKEMRNNVLFDKMEDGQSRANHIYDEYDNTSEVHKKYQEVNAKALDEYEKMAIDYLGYTPNVKHLFAFMQNPLVHDFKREGRDVDFSELLRQAHKAGNDGAVFYNVQDGGDFDTIYVVFKPSQFKSADPVTYDDNGNVIPLSKRFNQNTNDLRYSYDAEQMDTEYMDAVNNGDMETAQRLVEETAKIALKDSKVVDENGNLKVMYHSTDTPNFTKFDPSFSDDAISLFYTDDPEVADTYSKIQNNGSNVDLRYLPNKINSIEEFNKFMENKEDAGVRDKFVKVDDKLVEELKQDDNLSWDDIDRAKGKYIMARKGTRGDWNYFLKDVFDTEEEVLDHIKNDEYWTPFRFGNRYKLYLDIRNPLVIDGGKNTKYDADITIKIDKQGNDIARLMGGSSYTIEYSGEMSEQKRFDTIEELLDYAKKDFGLTPSEEKKILKAYNTQTEPDNDWVMEDVEIGDREVNRFEGTHWNDINFRTFSDEASKYNNFKDASDYNKMLNDNFFANFKITEDAKGNLQVYVENKNGKTVPLGRFSRQNGEANELNKLMGFIQERLYAKALNDMKSNGSDTSYIDIISEFANKWGSVVNTYTPSPGSKTRDVSKYAKENGYDGVIFKNLIDIGGWDGYGIKKMSTIAVAFDPNQAKSADPVTYDNDGNIIPLSERFNPENDDIRYSFDGEEDAKKYYATIAPYLDTRLNENNRQELIDKAEKAYDGVAKEIAKSLGISPAPKTENIGGYENNEGQKLRELSWTFDLGEIDSTKARLFTSLMGDLAFENQEAVICMRYLDENEGDHKVGEEGEDGGTYGKEYGFQFNDLKTVEESLLKADIANYNIDRESNYLKVQDFGFDPNFDQKLDILLEGNNYESAEERPIYSYYLSREGRQSLYETQLKTKEGVREGNESDLSGRQVEEANRRVSDVIKNGQNSPFLRRAEAQDNERSDLEFTEKDLKNYNVIRPTTERKYSEDKNIDRETGVLSPKFITELDATVGRTTRKAEIDDAESYAEMVATQLDNGADPEDVLNQIKEEPLNNGVIRALTIGQVLADRGLYDEMHELAQWARDTDRLAGQLIESNKHLHQLDNEMSRSIYLTKVEQNLIDEYNAKFKRKSDIDIEETVHKIFSDAFEATVKSKTVREFRDAVGALARQVNKAMPKTVWDRIRQYRMISMLSGIKTAVSNFVSNVATHGLYRMNNFNQAILEMAMKDITVKNVDDTRKFTISDDQRNTTLRKNREVSKRNKRYADKIWEQIDKGAKSKYGDDVEKIPDIIKNSKAYKTKTQYNTVGFKAKNLAGKALDLVQSVQAYMLDDSPIAKLAFRDRFNDICQARNIDVRTLDPNSKQFASVVDSAFDYAEEVVSHNATAISKTLANIQKYSSTNVRVDKDSLTKGVDEAIKMIKERANKGESMYVLLDGTLRKMEDWFVPFYKTNASLMQKAFQFSPLEWAQVKNDYDKVKAGRMDLVDMVDHMSKAVTGTTLYMLGAIFAYLGWLKWDKDDEDYSGRLAIKIPGTNIGYTADFLDPISTIFAKGVVLAQELMENGVSFATLQKLAGDYGDIFLNDEMDMFSSMKDFFDTVGKVQKGEDDYGEYTIADGATDTAFTILNSYIPALMRDISRVIDPAKKSTYDNSNMKYLFNRLLNSTPFRTKLADKKDATGRTINYTQPFTGNDVFDRILTQMVSKGKLVDMEGKAVTTRSDNGNLGEKADEMSQMAQDFQFNDANGDGYSDTHWIRDTVPANIYPGGEQVQLGSEERDEYGKTWTDVWTSGAKSLFNNEVYKGLDYEKQADVVYELQGFARECIEADYCLEHNIDPTKAQKTALAIRNFCTTNGKIDGNKLGLIALGTAKENKLANGGQRYVLGKRDENGKTITNSRQLYMRQLYEQAGIYDEIVKAVAENDNLSYQDFGLGKTVVEKYSADTAKSKYAEIYGAVMSDSSNKKTSSSGSKKSSRKSSKKSSNISGGSSGIRKAGKLNKLAPVTSKSLIKTDNKIANNFTKAYASVFNRSGKKPSAGGSSRSVACPRCGASVSANADKCPICGANL